MIQKMICLSKNDDFHTINLPKSQRNRVVVFYGSVAILEGMEWLKKNWYLLLAAALLIGALGQHPYGYYQLLRWVVSIVAFYKAYELWPSSHSFWKWVFIAIGVLFNPIRPFYLDRETWQILDLAGGVVLSVYLLISAKLKS